MKKKVISMVCSMAMAAALLAGCSGTPVTEDATSTAASTETAETEASEEASTEAATEAAEAGDESAALNIAIVSSPSGVDDGSFNQNNYEGIQAFIAENPDSKVTPIKEETGDTAACYQTVEGMLQIMKLSYAAASSLQESDRSQRRTRMLISSW